MRLSLIIIFYVFLLVFIEISVPKDALSALFIDETASRLPAVNVRFGWTAVFCDVDGDGDLDIYVGKEKASSTNPNDNDVLLINQGVNSRVFADESAARLPLNDAMRIDVRSFGIDCGDVDGDGDVDIILDNNSYQSLQFSPYVAHDVLLVNQGGAQGGTIGFFANGSNQLDEPITDITFAVHFIDIEGDGDLDIFESNYLSISNIQVNQGGAQGGTQGFFKD